MRGFTTTEHTIDGVPRTLRLTGFQQIVEACERALKMSGLGDMMRATPENFLPDLARPTSPGVFLGTLVLFRYWDPGDLSQWLLIMRADHLLAHIHDDVNLPYFVELAAAYLNPWAIQPKLTVQSILKQCWALPIPRTEEERRVLGLWLFVHGKFCHSFEEARQLKTYTQSQRKSVGFVPRLRSITRRGRFHPGSRTYDNRILAQTRETVGAENPCQLETVAVVY